MPTLNATPLDIALPSPLTHRRAWAHPELMSHSLLVLTTGQLYLAPLAGEPRPQTLAAVEAGADLDDVFGPLAVVIDLARVRRLKLDLLTNSLLVEYSRVQHGASRQRVQFATAESADACFTKIWRRLGDEFQLAPYARDSWRLARPPLMLLFGALLAAALLVLLLNVFQDMDAVPPADALGTTEAAPPPPGWFAWLDWRVVCAVGGVVAALSQIWLYRRITAPPVALELNRR
jgi:hypothetical protein